VVYKGMVTFDLNINGVILWLYRTYLLIIFVVFVVFEFRKWRIKRKRLAKIHTADVVKIKVKTPP
jgi:hypothetical protein